MPNKIATTINLIKNMGWRYIGFRIKHQLLKKLGWLKRKFPVAPPFQQYLTLAQWKKTNVAFFIQDRETLTIPRKPTDELKIAFETLKSGDFLLFNSTLAHLGLEYDWVTNPDTGYQYSTTKHWTEIADLSKEAGDIKYVWEKSRFSYLYDIIRYDYHFKQDCAEMVFGDILSWIKGNPINCGPNYRCSQEISLRILNWTYALYYYKNSPQLTDEVFAQIQFAIYWQIDHVYKNIDFSRIAVRNNHAITETLTLYLVGLLYPQLPNAAKYKQQGKKWFEEEIAYQIYEDGTFLQFSMNYHRVVVQLLTWAITLSEKNKERFSDTVYDRATKSLQFLSTCMCTENGWLPNYGNNDGALFFKFGDAHFRDYRPQLRALGCALGINTLGNYGGEDALWYGIANPSLKNLQPAMGMHSFAKGGYYIIKEPDTLTFMRCGNHKDRPHQADNLHIDIWYKGENILLDAGSYKYNTDEATLKYFMGAAAHNTIMLGNNDQMLKGSRFIWYYWSQCVSAQLTEDSDSFTFIGEIKVFQYMNKNIAHKRTLIKKKGIAEWHIIDEIINLPPYMSMKQLWHSPLKSIHPISISATNQDKATIIPVLQQGWYSSLYGQKENTQEMVFSTTNNSIETVIVVEG